MIEFPSFEFVVVDKNAKGKERLAGAKGLFGSPFVAVLGERMRMQPRQEIQPAGRLGSLMSAEEGRKVSWSCCRVTMGRLRALERWSHTFMVNKDSVFLHLLLTSV